MNIEHLRRSLKTRWLDYYRKNREWITRLGVWVNCEGKRRPSSSFILGALSTLEPQLTQLLPLVVDLSSNPDRIIIALGLNFNPEEELEGLANAERPTPLNAEPVKILPSSAKPSLPSTQADRPVMDTAELSSRQLPDRKTNNPDEACEGIRRNSKPATRWD